MLERIEVAGRGLEARRVPGDDPDSPTIVLLHEALGCVSLWRDFPERLAAETGWPVVAWSRWGYGRSDRRPRPWPFDYHELEARLVPDVLEALGVGRHVLWGHSDGATIALQVAGLRPAPGLLGVVSVAGHVLVEEAVGDPLGVALERFEQGGLRERLARHHEDVEVVFGEWHRIWTDPHFTATWDIRFQIGASTVPTLVVQGADDEYATLDQVDAICASLPPPVTRVVLEEVGHQPMFEAPDDLAEVTAAFCRALG